MFGIFLKGWTELPNVHNFSVNSKNIFTDSWIQMEKLVTWNFLYIHWVKRKNRVFMYIRLSFTNLQRWSQETRPDGYYSSFFKMNVTFLRSFIILLTSWSLLRVGKKIPRTLFVFRQAMTHQLCVQTRWKCKYKRSTIS